MLKIAVLSGKGGTGKTTVAASLSRVIPGCAYADCDIEEPNGFLFLEPDLDGNEQVEVPVPEIDEDNCSGCGDCVRICQFNALAIVRERVLVFPQLCHHCGACTLVCSRQAISEINRSIGSISWSSDGSFFQGKLNIGEPAGIPIIAKLKTEVKQRGFIKTAIFDCSPGASCSVVNSLNGCDYALIVTEPTPFGLHDLEIAVGLVRQMHIPAGVVINKAGERDSIIEDYCHKSNLSVVMKIPYSRRIAEHYARGILPVETDEDLAIMFSDLYQSIREEMLT